MNNPFKFIPIDLTDMIAILALSIGFIMSINAGMNELSMSLATGFFGYVGGYTSGTSKSTEKKGSHQNFETGPSEDIVNTMSENSSKK
jgi:hypothetical protein